MRDLRADIKVDGLGLLQKKIAEASELSRN